MKKLLLVVLCLLLSGCSTASALNQEPLAGTALGQGFTVYPMESEAEDIFLQGNDIVWADKTGISVLRDAVLISRQEEKHPAMHPCSNGYYAVDDQKQQIIFVNSQLVEQRSIPFPEGMEGMPLLREDGSILYYCSGNSLRAMELPSGRTQILRKFSGGSITLMACAENLLTCRIDSEEPHFLLLNAENGAVLANSTTPFAIGFSHHLYGNIECLLVQNHILPLPAGFRLVSFLEKQNQAVVANGSLLRLYAMDSGKCLGQQQADGILSPVKAVCAKPNTVWLLAREKGSKAPLLCRWDISGSDTNIASLPVVPYSSPEEPDIDGLLQCRAYAKEIGKKYGFQIKIWTDALNFEPWDYHLVPEDLVPIIQEGLQTIDGSLGRFPEGFLNTLAENAKKVNLCLVRRIQGLSKESSLEIASGLHFNDEQGSYLILCPGPDLERAVYHELFHLIDSQITAKTSVFEHWNQLNPPDFDYDWDYQSNAARSSTEYLEMGNQYFIDTYSMSFPQEDRARILECAMMDHMQSLFQAAPMQAKLRTICLGIRNAFALTSSAEPLPWEQYLWQPLVP